MMIVSRVLLIAALVSGSAVVSMENLQRQEINIQSILNVIQLPQGDWSDVEWVQWYLNHGGNINEKGTRGMNLLMTSVFFGRPSLMRFLINRYARLDCTNEWGDTALHIAARAGRASMVRTLLVSGANKNIRNNNNRTALDEAYNSPCRHDPFYNQKDHKNFYFPLMIRRLEAPDKEKACSQLHITQY